MKVYYRSEEVPLHSCEPFDEQDEAAWTNQEGEYQVEKQNMVGIHSDHQIDSDRGCFLHCPLT